MNNMKTQYLFFLLLIYGFSTSLLAQQNHVNVAWDPQRNKEGITPFSARVISPEVHDDHTVTFRLMGPEVSSVTVSGGMFVGEEAGKRVPLVKGANGVWSVTIGPLEPNIYLYSIKICGEKT